MSRASNLTTTSFAVLGLLAIKPWTTYELAQQMDRSLGRIWPRATSKIYEEPKKLVGHGLASASTAPVGRRPRTVYTITDAGREALAKWLATPGAGPVLEFEQLLKVFFAENGSRDDTLASLRATLSWAHERHAESLAVGRSYLAGAGRFPQRLAQNMLSGTFLTEFYEMVARWAVWAIALVEQWPDDPRSAEADLAALGEVIRRGEAWAAQADADSRPSPPQPPEPSPAARPPRDRRDQHTPPPTVPFVRTFPADKRDVC